jgi:hypothetical protein
VDESDDVADQLAVTEDRSPEEGVRQVGHQSVAGVGVVGDVDVALARLADRLEHPAQRQADRDPDPEPPRGRERLAVRRRQRDHEVLRLLDEDCVRRPHDRLAGLVDDALEEVLVDLEGDGVGGIGCWLLAAGCWVHRASPIRLSHSSTVTR